MLIEYTLTDTTNGQTMRVNSDVLADHGCTLEEFTAIQADDWAITPEQITVTEEDITHLLYQPKLDEEYLKAETYKNSKFDNHSLTSAADILTDLKERGLYSDELDVVQWIKHARACARYPNGLWDQYYANKERIVNDLDPLPYTVFDDVVPIAQMELRFREIVLAAGQQL